MTLSKVTNFAKISSLIFGVTLVVTTILSVM